MANKTDHIDLDDISWDDWGDVDATGEGEWKDLNKKQKARKAVTHLKGGFVSGVRDRILTKDGQRKYIEKALPKEYLVAYDGAFETYDAVADLYDQASKEIGVISKKTGATLKPLVDKYNAKLPKKMREPLRKWTQNATKSNKNWDEGDRDEIQAIAQVNDIFAKQEANRLHQKEVIEQKAQTGMLKNQNSILIELLKTAKASRGYELEVDYVYKRKSLELQYRQFAIQRKILDVQQQTMKLQQASFEKLIHNTGLPDYVKIQTSEVAKQMMTQKVFGDAINKWGEVPSRVIQNMIRNSGKKIIKGIKGGGEQGTDILSFVVQMLTQENMSNDPVGDNIHSGTKTGMNVLEWLMSQKKIDIPFGPSININGAIAKLFDKARGNRKVVAGAQRLQYMQRHGRRKFREIANGGSTGKDWLDYILELSDFRQIVGKNVTSVRKSSKNLDEAALFDIGTKKAITEVIPGYLSRIHWELAAQRTGKTNHKLVTFDHTKNRFTNIDKLVNSAKEEIYRKNRANVDLVFNDIFKKVGFNNLSKSAQQAIQRTMVLRALEGQNFDLSILMNDGATSSQKYGLDPKVLKEIQDHLSSKKGFIKTNRNVHTSAKGQSTAAFEAMNQIAIAMDQLQESITNPLDVLRGNVSRGQGQVNAKLGITQRDSEGNESVNVAKYIAGLLGHDFTDSELRANRKFDAPKKKKKVEEMTAFERLQHMAEQENQGGADGTGFSRGGYTGDYHTSTPVGTVHGQEYVFDAKTVKRIGKETLDKIKSGKINVNARSTGFKTVFANKKGQGRFTDFLSNAKISLTPGSDIEQAKNILVDEIFTRYNNVTGTMPENLAALKKRAKRDIHLRTLLNRLETLDRLKSAKMGDFEKTRVLRRLANEWDSVALSTIGSRNKKTIHDAIQDLKDGTTKQRVKQGAQAFGDWANDKAKHSATAVNSMWNDLSSYSFGSGKTSDNDGLMKETLVTLAKGAFGVGKELAKARFYGFKVIPWGLKKILGSMVHRDSFNFLKYGLWLQDGNELKLYASGLQEGRYLNGDMEIIQKPNDIHGNIYDSEKLDSDGQPTLVMTAKEYRKGLFDHEGKQIVKPDGIGAKIAKGLSYVGWKGVKAIGKGFLSATKKYIAITSWPGRKLIDLIIREKKGKVQDPEALAQITMQDLIREEQRMTNTKLDDVIDNLEMMSGKNKKFNDSDGDGDRDGNALDKLNAFRNKTPKEKAQADKPKDDKKKEDKPSFISKIMDMVKSGLGVAIGSMGGLIGMLVKGGIMALLGTFGIKSLLGWLSGKGGQEKIDPNDPRLDPTSPEYDPDFAQPSMLQKGAGWALDKMNGLSPVAQGAIGLAGGYAAYAGAKGLVKGGAKLAWKGGKYVVDKLKGRAAAQVAAKAGTQVASSAVSNVAGAAARQGLLQSAKGMLTRQGLKTAGTFIARQAAFQAVRTGAVAIGSAIAGTVGLPVVLGVAAVGALGYGAYKLYKSMKKDEVMVTRARMASYGYEVDNEKKVTKLLEVEGYLLENCSVSEKGEVSFKEGTSEAKLQEYFNVNSEDQKSVEIWRKYFFQRFMPVFAQFLTAYKKHTGRTDLHKAEEVMSFQQMQEMLTDTLVKKGTESNPYLVMESGFAGEDKVELDKDEVFDIYATISTKLRSLVQKGATNKRQKERTKESNQVAKDAEKAESGSSQQPKKSVFEKVKDAAKTAAGFTLPGLMYKGVNALRDRVLNGSDSTTNPAASSWLGGLWNSAKESVSNAAHTLTNGAVGSPSSNVSVPTTPVKADKANLLRALWEGMARHGVTTKNEQAAFLSQISVESGNLKYTEEIASGQAYEGRKDLGNTKPGDGKRFKGRGLIQLTGRANYEKFSKAINRPDIMNNPEIVAKDATLAVESAFHYWNTRKGLRDAAQRGDIVRVSKLVNGGTNHLAERKSYFANYLSGKGPLWDSNLARGSTTTGGSSAGSSRSTNTAPAGTNSVLRATTGSAASTTSNRGSLSAMTTGRLSTPVVPEGRDTVTEAPGTNSVLASTTNSKDKTFKIVRYLENTTETISRFKMMWCGLAGYIMEPRGPDTTASGQDRRIPEGEYKIRHHNGAKHKNAFGVFNSKVPVSRAILIHAGSKPAHTLGCLLPGTGYKNGVMSGSSEMTKRVYEELRKVGPENVKLVIENKISGSPPADMESAEVVGSEAHQAQSVADSTVSTAKSGKAYAFKVNYMDFNGTSKNGLKGGHSVTVRDNSSENTSAVLGNAAQVSAAGVNNAPAGIVRSATGTSNFNVQKFVAHLDAKGLAKSSGYCARYVMNALVAAGIPNTCRQASAYMYPNALLKHGFHEISMSTTPQAGDIVVNDKGYNGKSKHGHIQGFTGSRWISDFKQNRLVTALGRMFRHASLSNGTPLANKDLSKPASGTDDSKKDTTKSDIGGSSLNNGIGSGRRTSFTGIGTFKTGYNSNVVKPSERKTDAGTLANAGYAASLGLGTGNNGVSPLGNLTTLNGQSVGGPNTTGSGTTLNGQPNGNSVASTLKYELINSNGKRALSFTLRDGSKFIVELDAIGPAGRRTTIDDKEVVIKRDGTVTDYVNSTLSQQSARTAQTPDQMAQAVNGKLNPDGSITYPGPDGKPITVSPKDVGPAGHKTHTGVVLFAKKQMEMPASSATDIKRALDKPGTYVDIHGIVRNQDGTPALIAGKPVSVTTKDGNLTTTITRTPYYLQKLPPEIQKLEEERQKQEAMKKANVANSPTNSNNAIRVESNPLTQTATKVGQQSQQTLAQAQEQAKLDQQKLQQQLTQQKANEVRTQQMQQAQVARQTQEALSTSAALNEQLKVQRDMLRSLQNIEKHFSGRQSSWQQTPQGDSSQAGGTVNANNRQVGQAAGLQIKGVPKVEPMSMSK